MSSVMHGLQGVMSGTVVLFGRLLMYNFLTDSSLSPTIADGSYGAISPLPRAQFAEPQAGDDRDVWTRIRWPSRRPTLLDVAWTAGVFEGEGSFGDRQVRVTQKDREILDWIQALFGGRVGGPYLKRHRYLGDHYVHVRYATGERGRAVARTIYHFLSERRKAQARAYVRVSRETDLPERLTADSATRYLVDFRDLPPGVLP